MLEDVPGFECVPTGDIDRLLDALWNRYLAASTQGACGDHWTNDA